MAEDFKGYTVAEVIASLAEQPQDAIVVMSSDEEGNMLSPMHSLSKAAPYVKGKYDNSNYIDNGTKIVILWPSH